MYKTTLNLLISNILICFHQPTSNKVLTTISWKFNFENNYTHCDNETSGIPNVK